MTEGSAYRGNIRVRVKVDGRLAYRENLLSFSRSESVVNGFTR